MKQEDGQGRERGNGGQEREEEPEGKTIWGPRRGGGGPGRKEEEMWEQQREGRGGGERVCGTRMGVGIGSRGLRVNEPFAKCLRLQLWKYLLGPLAIKQTAF